MTSTHHPGDPSHPEPTDRLFFALWPDEPMQAALATAARQVVATCDGTRVPTQNFHFTLAFLGNVPISRTRDLGEISGQVAAVARGPIALTLDHIDYWRRPHILCATSTLDATAATILAANLTLSLTEHGFAPDRRRSEPAGKFATTQFRPHVTLARKVQRPIPPTQISPLTWTFAEFALVRSRIAPSGAVHTVLEYYPLT